MDRDSEAGNTVVQHFYSIAEPAKVSSVPMGVRGQSEENHYSVEYDPETDTETVLVEDEFYLDPILEQTEYVSEGVASSFPLFDTPLTRSFANWAEYNPQDWPDTKTIFKLSVFYGNKVIMGTAFKVGGSYLATAGHVVYNHEEGGWPDNILCTPAWRDSPPHAPLGQSYVVNGNMTCGGNWRVYGDESDDWGIVQTRNPLYTGYMGKRCVGDPDSIVDKEIRIAGYPSGVGPMQVSRGYVTGDGRRLVTADYNSTGGQSGSPIQDADGYVIGIHQGISDGNFDSPWFVKFDTWIFNKMYSYM